MRYNQAAAECSRIYTTLAVLNTREAVKNVADFLDFHLRNWKGYQHNMVLLYSTFFTTAYNITG